MRRVVGPVLAVAAGVLILFLLHKAARDIDYHAMIRALRHTRHGVLWASLGATAVSFLSLIGRDVCALRYVGAKVPPAALALGSFCGTALGNAVGFGVLAGGAVRYRIFGAVGISPEQVARMMLFITATFAFGLVGCAAVAAVIADHATARLLHLAPLEVRMGGYVLLAALAASVVACAIRKEPLRLWRYVVALPGPGLMLMQILLVGVDVVAAGAALWVLLPHGAIDFVPFCAVFAVATALGVLSHVPGGVGVFEAVVLFALGRHVSPTLAGAALLAYRGIYFALPLLLSALLLAGFESWRLAGKAIPGAPERLLRGAGALAPSFLAVLSFALGVMLLVSGATPAFGGRLVAVHGLLPLWAIEASNFLASLTGALLLFVSRGLFHRLDGAWLVALLVAAANLTLSMAKGLAIIESGAFFCLLLTLLATRRQFNRPASLLRQPFTLGWFAAVAIVVGATAWALLFAFHDVRYSHELWWRFELDAQAPRALRAVLGAAVVAIGGALWLLLRPAAGRIGPPGVAELAKARAIVAGQGRADAMLALMGDKHLLFSASGRSFLMYARHGRSWVTLYDPVGPREEWAELIWQFVEMADAHGGRAAFYEVRPDSLPFYLDAGLKIMKLGEEAVIPLETFSTQGGQASALRYTLKRGEREQFALEVLAPSQVAERMDQLATISKAWLTAHKAHEKGFSIAAFAPEFVAGQWVALLSQAGQPVAFVSVMATETRNEAAVGLMRHTPEASRYAMEYLFIRLALHLKEQGFRRFSLGMAPLSGIERRAQSSTWHHVAALLWQHGNWVYSFQGLRDFKNKFRPAWEPRYLAASGLVGPYLALTDVVALTGESP